jgi:Ca2+-binding EF-hand superfamily protein
MKKALALAGVLALTTGMAFAAHPEGDTPEQGKKHRKFDMIDTDSDGFISKHEMFEAHRSRVDNIFKTADEDQDGKLSKTEMKGAKKKLRDRMQKRWEQNNQPDEE